MHTNITVSRSQNLVMESSILGLGTNRFVGLGN